MSKNTVPRIAMPSAPPSCWTALSVPAADPVSCGSTPARIEVEERRHQQAHPEADDGQRRRQLPGRRAAAPDRVQDHREQRRRRRPCTARPRCSSRRPSFALRPGAGHDEPDDHAGRLRRAGEAGLERRVAEPDLQVEAEHQREADHAGEEREAGEQTAGERALAEQARRDQRIAAAGGDALGRTSRSRRSRSPTSPSPRRSRPASPGRGPRRAGR